jgi:hypothetical protein
MNVLSCGLTLIDSSLHTTWNTSEGEGKAWIMS